MPHGDKAGPAGAGPMKGRRAGYCTGNVRAGWQAPSSGRAGRAHSTGWGFHRFPRDYQTVTPTETDVSRKALESERDVLHGQLEEIEQQLSANKATNK
ncbi:DUF5320 domain-containing protein [Pontiellaceae bacterium B1224]|nr:DUF5320 domain-containing protein [Pontiellaceae bacterium B1224]